MKKWIFRIIGLLILLMVLAIAVIKYQTRDRFPDYSLDITQKASSSSYELQAGFGALSINPDIPDRWIDTNDDNEYNPESGDTIEDGNGNGKFDASWMAGFGKNRAANGIHDSLWARAMVIDDGQTRMALVVIDAIGFGHDDVIRVRNRIPDELRLTYTSVMSTHTHQGPDLVGLWGPKTFSSGVDPAYMERVIQRTADAVIQATKRLRPAKFRIGLDMEGAQHLVADTRDPQVLDYRLTTLQAIDESADTTLGTLIAWADHPETLWSKNLLITSDFVHYVRDGVEKGIYHNDSLMVEGLGGTAVYVNGSIGGLMTTHPTTPIPDLWEDTVYLKPSFDKARAQGENLAKLALASLDSTAEDISMAGISLRAKTITLPLDNDLFKLAAVVGVLDRGMTGWMNMRTEVAAWSLGPMSVIQVPGEIYPEIVNGGIEAPSGQDFELSPQETPSLRSMMPGKYTLVFGLANDLLGYIIPKSEWDVEPPYLYDSEHDHYGEINSVGPETAPLLHKELSEILNDLKDMSAQP